MLQSPPSNLSIMFSQPDLLLDRVNWELLKPKAIARVLIEEEKKVVMPLIGIGSQYL